MNPSRRVSGERRRERRALRPRVFFVLGLILVLGSLFAPSASSAATISGTGGGDTLVGTNNEDLIYGFGGKDFLFGKAQIDDLRGGPGDDILQGDSGISDWLRGNDGDDQLDGIAHNCNFYPRHFIGGAGFDVAWYWPNTNGGPNEFSGIEQKIAGDTDACLV